MSFRALLYLFPLFGLTLSVCAELSSESAADLIKGRIVQKNDQIYSVNGEIMQFADMNLTPEMEAELIAMVKRIPAEENYPESYLKNPAKFLQQRSRKRTQFIIHKTQDYYIYSYYSTNPELRGNSSGLYSPNQYLNTLITDTKRNRDYEVDHWAKKILIYENQSFMENKDVEFTVFPENVLFMDFLRDDDDQVKYSFKKVDTGSRDSMKSDLDYFELPSIYSSFQRFVGFKNDLQTKELISYKGNHLIGFVEWAYNLTENDSRDIPFFMERKVYNETGGVKIYTVCRLSNCTIGKHTDQPDSVRSYILGSIQEGYSYVISMKNGKEKIITKDEFMKQLDGE